MRFFISVLRVGIAVAVINAAVRMGGVYWAFYQFEDAAQQLALFGWQTSPDALHSSTLAKAGELQIPITDEQVSVTRDGSVTVIEAQYEQPVEYFPNRRYPLKFSFKVEGRNLTAAPPPR